MSLSSLRIFPTWAGSALYKTRKGHLYDYVYGRANAGRDPYGLGFWDFLFGEEAGEGADVFLEELVNLPTVALKFVGSTYDSTKYDIQDIGYAVLALKGGGEYGDDILGMPIAADFLKHAMSPLTIAGIEGTEERTHTNGSTAVNAILASNQYRSPMQEALEIRMQATADGMSCSGAGNSTITTIHSHNGTSANVNFTSGDLHFAIGHITFKASGNCTISMVCKNNTCCSVSYTCANLSITAKDKYDFAWDSNRTKGALINNFAYVAQENGKLGVYTNKFDFTDSFSGSLSCPVSGASGSSNSSSN